MLPECGWAAGPTAAWQSICRPSHEELLDVVFLILNAVAEAEVASERVVVALERVEFLPPKEAAG